MERWKNGNMEGWKNVRMDEGKEECKNVKYHHVTSSDVKVLVEYRDVVVM